MKPLFITNVGSHMWGMQKPESDLDLMIVTQASTRDILEGRNILYTTPDKKYHDQGVVIDQKEQEIGHLVNQLLKGNVNAIWTVTTPVVIKDHTYLGQLRQITVQNLSKASYASIRGMAISQKLDIEKRKNVMPPFKAARTAIRTCHFGIYLLEQKKIDFDVRHIAEREPDEKEVDHWLHMLENAYESSRLPEEVDKKPFRDFLYNARIEELLGEDA